MTTPAEDPIGGLLAHLRHCLAAEPDGLREVEEALAGELSAAMAAALADEDDDGFTDEDAREQLRQRKLAADREIRLRREAGEKALARLDRLAARQRAGRERFVCYCPAKPPCRLITAYRLDAPRDAPTAGQPTLLLVAHNGRHRRPFLPEWTPSDEWRLDPVDWLPIRCRHGHGRFTPRVPGQMTNSLFTADSAHRRRTITDLIGVSGIAWTDATSMLRP